MCVLVCGAGRCSSWPSRASPRTYVSSYGRPYRVRKQYSACSAMCRSTGLEAWRYRKATRTSSGTASPRARERADYYIFIS